MAFSVGAEYLAKAACLRKAVITGSERNILKRPSLEGLETWIAQVASGNGATKKESVYPNLENYH